jgi:hypothetical protein
MTVAIPPSLGSAPTRGFAGVLEVAVELVGLELKRRDTILAEPGEELDARAAGEGRGPPGGQPTQLEEFHRRQQPELARGVRWVSAQQAQDILRNLHRRGHRFSLALRPSAPRLVPGPAGRSAAGSCWVVGLLDLAYLAPIRARPTGSRLSARATHRVVSGRDGGGKPSRT